MIKKLVYLHGFASSSQSEKAQLTQQYFTQHWPQLDFAALDIPYEPLAALDTIQRHLDGETQVALIGSSLGGFLATCIAEQLGCRACLINPAVAPHQVLSQHLGRYFHPVLQQHYDVGIEHIAVLQQLMPTQLQQPQNYLVLLQSGDEVLDYRMALEYYRGASIDVVDGGDHSYVGYARQLDTIAKFCQLA